MTTKQITATNADDQIKQFYESAFPVEEQIPWDDLVRLIGEMGPGLSLLNKVKDPDAVALMQYIGLETYLQERAKTIPPSRPNHPVSIRDVGDRWASCAS